jgi:hypothetical protein
MPARANARTTPWSFSDLEAVTRETDAFGCPFRFAAFTIGDFGALRETPGHDAA